jgi:hypothetical protein
VTNFRKVGVQINRSLLENRAQNAYFCIVLSHISQIMTDTPALKKFSQLSEPDQHAVEQFIDFLLNKQKKQPVKTTGRKGYGSWKGIQISDDFNAPLGSNPMDNWA